MASIRYGLLYQGSKSRIAKEILSFLPTGKRLVDLFGGGGSISHCALSSDKWDKVLYNELNPLVCDLFDKAIHGYYRDLNPEWISRDEFNAKKDVDGYIRLIWSFGNNGTNYIFGRDIEEEKHSIFEYIVNGKRDEFIDSIFGGYELNGDDWKQRKSDFIRFARQNGLPRRTQELEVIERIQGLEGINSLERIDSLEITNMDYRDYEYREGDVVYCDPPYEGADCKAYKGFDNKAFYDWVDSRPYGVFFSSYEISDNRFLRIWERRVNQIYGNKSNAKKVTEFLYTNKLYRKSLIPVQLELDL